MPTDRKDQHLIDFEKTSKRHVEETREQTKPFPYGTPATERPAPPTPTPPAEEKR